MAGCNTTGRPPGPPPTDGSIQPSAIIKRYHKTYEQKVEAGRSYDCVHMIIYYPEGGIIDDNVIGKCLALVGKLCKSHFCTEDSGLKDQ